MKFLLVHFCRLKAFAASYWMSSKLKRAARKDKILTPGPMEYFTSAAETESLLNFFAVSSLHVTSSSFVQSSSGIVECCLPRFKFVLI